MLKRISLDQLPALRREPVAATTLDAAAKIVEDVRIRGVAALREHAERLGDLAPGAPLTTPREAMQAAFEALPAEDQSLLIRAADRIRRFAEAQRSALSNVEIAIPGGVAGHEAVPMECAGCYAPGGRYPLPSSMLMTAVTARAAGVRTVWAASPKPAPATLAAAYVVGLDGLLNVGGAQGIAALAYGAGDVPACDVVVGPGNRWVTAAKQLVSGNVAIDMLAGPSELVVLADGTANAAVVAADLLAQAEHDDDAVPILVTTSAALAEEVDAELERQLADLPTREVAARALQNGFTLVAASLEEAVAACDRIAPEHLEVHLENPSIELRNYGGLFRGARCAEVFGDYGAGPNHTLPTGGTAHSFAGLSVFTFLRVRTWMRIDERDDALIDDTARFARMEGLEAHARSAEARRKL
ncbi:MAG: histidinol dehydrogenase [Fimbriimonadales bacterium]